MALIVNSGKAPERQVRGSLFADYVRMIKKNKQTDWSKHLDQADLEFLKQIILANQWYPMDSYQRLGAAIFTEIAHNDPEVARQWGRISMDRLVDLYKNRLIESGNPLKTLEKFRLLNKRFFNFEGFYTSVLGETHVSIRIDRGFGTIGVQGYSYQMLGSLQRLLEHSGALGVKAEFSQKNWEGSANSVMDMLWQGAGPAKNP